jgi:hypothetical protein
VGLVLLITLVVRSDWRQVLWERRKGNQEAELLHSGTKNSVKGGAAINADDHYCGEMWEFEILPRGLTAIDKGVQTERVFLNLLIMISRELLSVRYHTSHRVCN